MAAGPGEATPGPFFKTEAEEQAMFPTVIRIVGCGEVAGNAAATVMPTLNCRMARFKAEAANAGNVYVGLAAVTKADGTTDTTTGLELAPGDDTGWLPCSNLNDFYRICDNAGDDLTYLCAG